MGANYTWSIGKIGDFRQIRLTFENGTRQTRSFCEMLIGSLVRSSILPMTLCDPIHPKSPLSSRLGRPSYRWDS